MPFKSICLVTPIYPPDIGGPATYSFLLKKNWSLVKQVIVVSKLPPVFRHLKLFFQVLTSSSKTIYSQDPLVSGLIAHLAAKLTNKKILTKYVGDPAWEHYQDKGGQLSLEEYLLKKNTLWFYLTQLSFSLADRIIVPSQYLKEILKTYYNQLGQKIIVIPNFVVTSRSGVAPAAHSGMVPKLNQIVFVARPKPWKNLEMLISAFNQLKLPDWQLKIAGFEGKDTNKVKYLGKLKESQVAQLLSQSKILCLPSSYEGFSHVLLEAGKAKCAVIASDILANKEIITHNQTGLLFSLSQPNTLKLQLKKLVSNQQLISRLANNLNQSIKPYSLNNHLKTLQKVYEA